MRIAVDAMGGDHGPRVVVAGALNALGQLDAAARLLLVGDEVRIRQQLGKQGLRHGVEVVHAPDEVSMDEAPASAVRRKPNSSLARGLRLVQDNAADAFISAGSTGAVVAGGTLGLGRIGSVQRPAIAALFPTERASCVLLDVGANSDCKPIHLLQFAAMGAAYAHIQLGLERPSIGLLNIGEEETKGNELALAAFALLRDSGLNFIGNVEGRDVLLGRADVVVCDGFVGNILLKFGESMLRFMKRHLQREAHASLRARVGGLLMKPAFRGFQKRVDYQEEGGAPLLGVNGVVVIAHGKSSERAIANAVLRGARLVSNQLNEQIRERIAFVLSRVSAPNAEHRPAGPSAAKS